MKEDCSVYDAKAGEEIENEFHEKWVKLDHKHKAYKVAEKTLNKIDRDEYRMCLLSVVSIDDDSHFLAFYSGGLNGEKKDNIKDRVSEAVLREGLLVKNDRGSYSLKKKKSNQDVYDLLTTPAV